MYYRKKIRKVVDKKFLQPKNYILDDKDQCYLNLFDNFLNNYYFPLKNKLDKIKVVVKSDSDHQLNLATKFCITYINFLKILAYLHKHNSSVKKYFSYQNKHYLMSRAKFYYFKIKLEKLLNQNNFNWEDQMNELPIKKTIEYKYDEKTRKLIVDYYLIYIKKHQNFKMIDFWKELRQQQIFNTTNCNLSKIAINTIKWILYRELGLIITKNKVEKS